MPATEATESASAAATGGRRSRPLRLAAIVGTLAAVLVVLFGVPWWTVALAGAQWPAPAVAAGTLGFACALLALPALMVLGHGPRARDWAARTGDTLLGVVWVLFAWAVLGNLLLRPALAVAGLGEPARSRLVAGVVVAVSLVLVLWGYVEAMRVPRIARVTVPITRLGKGLDGLRVVLLTDTHYGPINRTRWSARVVEAVNALDADLVCHTGDIADGSVDRRRAQTAPLGHVRARLARVYVTGNHEYFGATGQAQQWLDHLHALGWEPLHGLPLVTWRHRLQGRVEGDVRNEKKVRSGLQGGCGPDRDRDRQVDRPGGAGAGDQPGHAGQLGGAAAARCEPATVRYRLLHVAARLTRGQRRRWLRLPAGWPWAQALTEIIARIRTIPLPHPQPG